MRCWECGGVWGVWGVRRSREKNSELLRLMSEERFAVLLASDRSLRYEQSCSELEYN